MLRTRNDNWTISVTTKKSTRCWRLQDVIFVKSVWPYHPKFLVFPKVYLGSFGLSFRNVDTNKPHQAASTNLHPAPGSTPDINMKHWDDKIFPSPSSGCAGTSLTSVIRRIWAQQQPLGPREPLPRHLAPPHCIYIHIHLAHCSLLSQVQQSRMLNVLPWRWSGLIPLLIRSPFCIQVRYEASSCNERVSLTVQRLFSPGPLTWCVHIVELISATAVPVVSAQHSSSNRSVIRTIRHSRCLIQDNRKGAFEIRRGNSPPPLFQNQSVQL